jgi:ATP-dependent 26S proteasome regulatory subunit
VFGET